MRTENCYISIGRKFVKAVRHTDFDNAIDFKPILDVLDFVKIKDGYVLDFFKTSRWEYHTIPYARKQDAERKDSDLLWYTSYDEKEFLQKFDIPFSEMGIWQGYLLHALSGITPKYGHAEYCAVTEIYGDKDLQEIIGPEPLFYNIPDDIAEALSKYIGSKSIVPSVRIIDEEHAEVTAAFWSEFGGLVQETTIATKNENTIFYEAKDQVVLVKYDCGVNF